MMFSSVWTEIFNSIKVLALLSSINYFYSERRSYLVYWFGWDEKLKKLCHGSFSGKSSAFMMHVLSTVPSQVMSLLGGCTYSGLWPLVTKSSSISKPTRPEISNIHFITNNRDCFICRISYVLISWKLK